MKYARTQLVQIEDDTNPGVDTNVLCGNIMKYARTPLVQVKHDANLRSGHQCFVWKCYEILDRLPGYAPHLCLSRNNIMGKH